MSSGQMVINSSLEQNVFTVQMSCKTICFQLSWKKCCQEPFDCPRALFGAQNPNVNIYWSEERCHMSVRGALIKTSSERKQRRSKNKPGRGAQKTPGRFPSMWRHIVHRTIVCTTFVPNAYADREWWVKRYMMTSQMYTLQICKKVRQTDTHTSEGRVDLKYVNG